MLTASGLALTVYGSKAFAQDLQLQAIDVFSTAPLGSEINALEVPSETQVITGAQISNLHQQTLQDALARNTPGVSVTDSIGSPLSQSVDFRGETASPVPGTPQGLAVYMNGVRINESYGDVVNWDLIPDVAIDRAELVTGNPVFGLNALAGAVVLKMKNGFTWQGTEINLQGGMDFTVQGSAQYGIVKDNWAYYVAIQGIRTNGYRYYGQSDAEKAYGDIGYRAEGNEVHLSVTGGADGLGVAGTTPIQLATQNPWAVFTTPQTTQTTAQMITLSDESHITPTLTFNGNAYFRSYAQAHHDGNVSDYYHCTTSSGLPGDNVCNGGNPIAGLTDPLAGQGAPDGQPLGEIDSNWTHTLSTGATAQLTDTDKIFDHNNTITGGISLDHGWTHFSGASVLSSLPGNLVIPFSGNIIDDPTNDVSPVDLKAQNNYFGVYLLDTFAVTDKLSVNAGFRFNDATIRLQDTLSGAPAAVSAAAGTYGNVNASQNFQRINPVAGVTYKLTPDVAAYASYSEANRAPTPLELGCSSPTTPCMIDNFLVSDPPLKQIVSRTVEAGLKSSTAVDWAVAPGRLNWSISAYRTENQNDIYSVASPTVIGFGYYTNAGDTLREGVDIGASYVAEKWDAHASYSYIRATFLTPISLSSPNNPTADPASGAIQVNPGDNIPGIPNHKFKFGMDYEALPGWKIGGDVVYRSSQFYVGAENNTLGPGLNPRVSGYATLNLRTSYQVSKEIQIYGLINNALNYRGSSYGTLYQVGSTQNQVNGNPAGVCDAGLYCSADPRAVTLAPPLEAMIGVKYTMSVPPPAPALVAKY